MEEGMMMRPVPKQRTLESKVNSDSENGGVEQAQISKTEYLPRQVCLIGKKRYGITESGAKVELGSSESAKIRLELAWRAKYEPQEVQPAQITNQTRAKQLEEVAQSVQESLDAGVVKTTRNTKDNSGLEVMADDSRMARETKDYSAFIKLTETDDAGRTKDATDELSLSPVRYCGSEKCALKFRKEERENAKSCGRCGEELKTTTEYEYSYDISSRAKGISFDSQTGVATTPKGRLKRKTQGVAKVAGVLYDDVAKVTKVVGTDIGRGLKKTAKAGFKAITYPTVGNLAANLQTRLEGLVGKEWYNGVRATDFSRKLNVPLYTASGACLAGYVMYRVKGNIPYAVASLIACGLVSFLYSGCEGANRGTQPTNKGLFDNIVAEPHASLIGKLVSLPIEACLGIYDRTKNYIKGVKERTKER